MARDKLVRAPSRSSPGVAGRGETGAHHDARLTTRATERGKRRRMLARTASRSRFKGYHNKALNDQPHIGCGSDPTVAERFGVSRDAVWRHAQAQSAQLDPKPSLVAGDRDVTKR